MFYLKLALDREKSDKMSIENQLKEKIRELQDLQHRFDTERTVNTSK
jgi:hypothetical protein